MRVRMAAWLLGLLVWLVPSAALADAAPVLAVGPGLQPVATTKVRLESERIELSISHRDYWDLSGAVRVQFHFMPTADETLEVGFPLWAGRQIDMNMGRLDEFAVMRNGTALPYEERQVTFEGKAAPWAMWKLHFQKDVPLDLEVTYRWSHLSLAGKRANAPIYLAYVLKTGAFWAGTIGRAEAVLTMDRPIRAEDVLAAPAGWALKDGVVRWEWRDLEPDFDMELQVANAYWLDLPEEVNLLLSKPSLERNELLRLAELMMALYRGAGRDETWAPVRGGRLSGQVAMELQPKVVERFHQALQANPRDGELRERLLAMLLRSTFTYDDQLQGRWVFTGLDSLRAYLEERGVLTGDAGLLQRWAAETTQPMLPSQFESEAAARQWAEAPFARLPSGGLAEELRAAVLRSALDRVRPAPAAPAPVPIGQVSAAMGPAIDRPAWTWLVVIPATALVLAGVLFQWLRTK